jgi:hypothetical protein
MEESVFGILQHLNEVRQYRESLLQKYDIIYPLLQSTIIFNLWDLDQSRNHVF